MAEWTADEALPRRRKLDNLEDLINQIKTRVSGISDSLANRWALCIWHKSVEYA